ncbi:MAG: type IV toxin-antitoxin system AbiEi family antitoxin [Nevskiales bacterium]
MKTADLVKFLDSMDKNGVWAFRLSSLRLRFPQAERGLIKSLSSHQKAGLILKCDKGLYVNPRARSLPADILPALVPWLRPLKLNYLSLESVLSEESLISQVPARLTVMSTGKSRRCDTPFGTIEFVHTKRALQTLSKELVATAVPGLYRAPAAIALRDLQRSGRNLGLVLSEPEQ